ncbi:MAG: glycosyltransferase family 2 protein [Patescibacteria group bacterium]|jgi:glycosyltransferase involved in cell wall biosynthesis
MSKHITVVIHTRNAEKIISRCITSAFLVTDDVVVVDAGSTDKTASLSHKLGATVLTHPITTYVEPGREFDVQKSPGPWVFILDADEELTGELARTVKSIAAEENPPFTHYRIPRKNIFANTQWLKHGGWWPDYVGGRLLFKPSFISWPKHIHSQPVVSGKEGTLNEPFLHYFHSSLENMVASTIVYETIEAQQLLEAGRNVRTFTFFRKFLGELFRRLIKKSGHLDGTYGVIESMYQAYSKTITWMLLFEKKYTKQS